MSGFEKRTVQVAVALRRVVGLGMMGTMCACPVGVRWVRWGWVCWVAGWVGLGGGGGWW